MMKFYLYNRQFILNSILFIALILAFVMGGESGLKDFFLGVATSIAFINFINSIYKSKKEKQQQLFSND